MILKINVNYFNITKRDFYNQINTSLYISLTETEQKKIQNSKIKRMKERNFSGNRKQL